MALAYSPALDGRARIRIRETHLRDHLAPLLGRGADGAVKLDLLLRGLAGVGAENASDPGAVASVASWEKLHDLVRPGSYYAVRDGALKRKWVSDKLAQLENQQLLRRSRNPGQRSVITVLRDDGSGSTFDDPGAVLGESYVTVLGGIFASGRVQHWGAPQLAAYIAAMIAERYARADPLMAPLQRGLPLGGGVWFRPLDWFADEAGRRPQHHVRIPFSPRTLRRGFKLLRDEGLIATLLTGEDPRRREPFPNRLPRTIYLNGFDDLRPGHGFSSRRAGEMALHRILESQRPLADRGDAG